MRKMNTVQFGVFSFLFESSGNNSEIEQKLLLKNVGLGF